MKLIILNGPSGVGKSTIAALLHADIEDSILIDIDEVRRSIPNYKDDRQKSLKLSYEMAASAIDRALTNEKTVIIDKTITYADTLDLFVAIGREHNIEVYEFLLFADKSTIQGRADERGYKQGSILTPEKVGELWDRIDALRKERSGVIVIDTKDKSVEGVLSQIKQRII